MFFFVNAKLRLHVDVTEFQSKANENGTHLSTREKLFGFTMLFTAAKHQTIGLDVTQKRKRSNEQPGSDLDIRDQTRYTQTMPIKMAGGASLK